jgi:fructokinase
MNDFLTFGELLIDFTPSGEQGGQKLFMQNAGGAVANVAVAMKSFGVSAAYTGMVGNDAFGHYLNNVLKNKGVDTSGLVMSDIYNTTLAFVHLFPNGDRDFSFYRKPGADIMYSSDMIDENAIRKAHIFHFGSLSLTDEPARSATIKMLEIAKNEGLVVSYDPNYRAPLWNGEDEAKEMMLKGMEYADILKISDNEIDFLFGKMPYEEAARILLSRGMKLVFITMGSEGAIYAHQAGVGKAAPFAAQAVDATGAGDCFTGGVLSQFIKSGKVLEALTLDDIAGFARFANAAASICVEGKGGIPSIPSLEKVQQRLSGE